MVSGVPGEATMILYIFNIFDFQYSLWEVLGIVVGTTFTIFTVVGFFTQLSHNFPSFGILGHVQSRWLSGFASLFSGDLESLTST